METETTSKIPTPGPADGVKMQVKVDKETIALSAISNFNYDSKASENIPGIDVLFRLVCSVMEVIAVNKLKLNLFKTYPVGTIFTRTCRYDDKSGKGGGVCGAEFAEHRDRAGKLHVAETTFTNLTTLGNLMIGNPRSVNDSVIFLKAKKPVKFLDLNIISQIFGAQVKSGVAPGVVLGGDSRGIFSACCLVPEMPDFCGRLGVMGVIQVDIADAYYFNEDAEAVGDQIISYPIPPALLQSRIFEFKKWGARYIANELVLEALKNKRAYPIGGESGFYQGQSSGSGWWEGYVGSELHYGKKDARLKGSGALFPEFNFHIGKQLGGLTAYLEYCTRKDPPFQSTGSLTSLLVHARMLPGTVDIPYFSLNTILSYEDSAKTYLNFQKDKYRFEQINGPLMEYDWVKKIGEGILQINPVIIQRGNKINKIFSNFFIGLPYLCKPNSQILPVDNNIIDIEYSIAELMFNDHAIPSCGVLEGAFPSAPPEQVEKYREPLGKKKGTNYFLKPDEFSRLHKLIGGMKKIIKRKKNKSRYKHKKTGKYKSSNKRRKKRTRRYKKRKRNKRKTRR